MHQTCYKEMETVLAEYLGAHKNEKVKIVDVGSLDTDGSFRGLIAPTWHYIGVDTQPGKNVDLVLNDPHLLPFADNSVDVVISGCYLEHTQNPSLLVGEMARILCDGGCCFICASAKSHLHGYPHDYWRIYPRGIRTLLAQAGFTVVETYTIPVDALLLEEYAKHNIVDSWGIARKYIKTQKPK